MGSSGSSTPEAPAAKCWACPTVSLLHRDVARSQHMCVVRRTQPALPALAAVSSPHCFSSVAAPSAAGGSFRSNPTRAYDADASHYVPMGVAVPPMAAAAAPPPYAPPMQGTIPFGPGYRRPAIPFGPVRLPMAGPPHGRQSLLSPVAAPRACLRVQLRSSSAGSSSMKSCMPVAGIKAGSHKAMAATASWPTCRVCSYACDALRAGHVHTRLSIVASMRPLVCCKFALMSHRVAMAELE